MRVPITVKGYDKKTGKFVESTPAYDECTAESIANIWRDMVGYKVKIVRHYLNW